MSFNNLKIVDAYGARPDYSSRAFDFLTQNGFLGLNDVVVDIGTGEGRVLRSMFNWATARHKDELELLESLNIQAVDPSSAMLAKAIASFERQNVHYHRGHLGQIPAFDQAVDVIIGGSSWHWGLKSKEQTDQTVREVSRVLKPQGHIVSLMDGWCSKDGKDVFSSYLGESQARLINLYEFRQGLISEEEFEKRQADVAARKLVDDYQDEQIYSEAMINAVLFNCRMNHVMDLEQPVFMRSFLETHRLSVPDIQREFASQIYFDDLTREEKRTVCLSLDSAAKKYVDEDGLVECGRKTTVIAGYSVSSP